MLHAILFSNLPEFPVYFMNFQIFLLNWYLIGIWCWSVPDFLVLGLIPTHWRVMRPVPHGGWRRQPVQRWHHCWCGNMSSLGLPCGSFSLHLFLSLNMAIFIMKITSLLSSQNVHKKKCHSFLIFHHKSTQIKSHNRSCHKSSWNLTSSTSNVKGQLDLSALEGIHLFDPW